MPQPDPPPNGRQSAIQRFWRVFRLLAVLSVVMAGIAVVAVTRGANEIHASLIIATGLGVGLTFLLGSALMALMFVSSSSGHDDSARGNKKKDME
jgi:hypothetical protein